MQNQKIDVKNPRFLQVIDDLISLKQFRFMTYLDREITTNLIESEIETRPVKENGLWCTLLLPSVLFGYNILYNVSPLYALVTYISLGLLFYCCLLIVFMSVSCSVLKESIYGGCMASSLVSTMMMYAFLHQDLTYSFLLSVISVYGQTKVLKYCMTAFPKTFTVGEAMIVSQSVVLFVFMSVVKMFDRNNDPDLDLIVAVVNTVLATVGLIIAALYFMTDVQKQDIKNFINIIGASAAFAVIMLHVLLGWKSIPLVFSYVFFNVNRLKLFAFWLTVTGISVFVLLIRTQLAVKASTVARKSFHILASVVFLSGIIYDVHLITLASGVGLGLIILVEALRKADIQPISSYLQSAFLVYSDEKDCGTFAMTPMYLFCGLSCPLVLVPRGVETPLQLDLLSGVLSIGIGDTAASWFGSRYGFNKWPNSERSFEGTVFNILSQVLTVYTLQLFQLLNSRNALLRTAVAGTLSALVEAKTEQIDNLLLPMVMLIGFQVTSFLG